MNDFNIKYFLAANSCEGFVSSFKESFSAKDGWRAFIIKGGPGTGKSSFMKFLVAKAKDKKIKTELCFCSSDPNSLDAVIFPEKRVIVLDGTAPHTLDPLYPGVCERILNFGDFWFEEAFFENREEIISLTDKNKSLHRTAARYLWATGELFGDNLNLAAQTANLKKCNKFADSLCRKYIPKSTNSNSSEQVRYLCGITPNGVVSFAKTAVLNTKTQIIIEDKFGYISNSIMQKIRNFALANGYNIITVKNCFLPSQIIDHIIIPELSVAFLREYEYQHFDIPVRRVHSRRFLNFKQLKAYRERINFNKKAVKELLTGASVTLAKAKAVHDELENYYISAMDFDRLTGFANDFAEKLFG